MKRFTKMFFPMVLVVLLLPMVLTACSAEYVFPENVWAFFAGYKWEDLLGMAFSLLFGLFPGFNLFQAIKVKFGWEGQKAHWAVMGLSVSLTALLMFLAGAFNVAKFDITLANLLEWGVFVYGGSQIAYQRFKASQSS